MPHRIARHTRTHTETHARTHRHTRTHAHRHTRTHTHRHTHSLTLLPPACSRRRGCPTSASCRRGTSSTTCAQRGACPSRGCRTAAPSGRRRCRRRRPAAPSCSRSRGSSDSYWALHGACRCPRSCRATASGPRRARCRPCQWAMSARLARGTSGVFLPRLRGAYVPTASVPHVAARLILGAVGDARASSDQAQRLRPRTLPR